MSNKINIILTIIIIFLMSYIAYDKYSERREETNNGGSIIDNRGNNNSEMDVQYYSYIKDIKSDKDDNRAYKSVYLFEDNTYYYSYSDGKDNCNNWSKGKYTNEKNNVVLKEEVYGGCDTCYYKNSNKTYTFRMSNNSLVSDNNEMLALSKVDILPIIEVEKLDGMRDCTK